MEELSHQLDSLRYHADWLKFSFLEADLLHKQIAVYQSGEDDNTEHYRYAAFRYVLAARDQMSDAEIAHYVRLAQQDADKAMAQSALCDLLLWRGLTAEQFEMLAQEAVFAEPLFQKLILRMRLLDALTTSPVTAETFARCLADGDAVVQRELVSLPSLTSEQLQILARQGTNRAIRNMAQARSRKQRTDT